MAINYANRMGPNIVKIGMQTNDTFTRNRQYLAEMNIYAEIYQSVPCKPELIWFKNELSMENAKALESWMIEKLQPHLAAGNEWFYAKDEVLKFISKDPLKQWRNSGRPGFVKDPPTNQELIRTGTTEQAENGMAKLILGAYRRRGDLTLNRCRRIVHPERIKNSGLITFIEVHKKLVAAKILIPIRTTQRSQVYRVSTAE